jgi:WD40 repeat protein
MNDRRGRFACVELAGGKVAAFGSDVAGTYLSTAEVYDPATDRWTETAHPLLQGRWEHAAVRLADGRALVAGGYADDLSPSELSSVELFEPSAGTFTAAKPLLQPRKLPGLVRLSNGRVVAVGGYGISDSDVTSEIWDASTGNWTAWTPLVGAHAPAQAIALADDSVLVTGGSDLPERVSATGSVVTGAQVVPRDLQTLTLLADGTVLATGGQQGGVALSTAEIYDPKTNAWAATGAMAHPRLEHSAVRVKSGLVLVAGGEASGDVEAYDPTTRRFAIIGYLMQPRNAMCAVTQGDGALFLGGSSREDFNAYVPIVDRWSPTPAGLPCALSLECVSGSCISGVCASSALPPSDGGFEASTAPTSPIAPSTFQRCNKAADCTSGHCVEGVCCDTACDQKCFSCALPSAPGKCTAEPIGVDLKGECGAAQSCSGTCGPAHDCIGSGVGAQCAKPRCTSSSTGVGPAVCTGEGSSCPLDQAVPFDCGAYACEPAFGVCLSNCSASTDCAGGFLCETASRTCVAPPSDHGSGGCALGGGEAPTTATWLAPLAGLAAFARARRRASRSSRPPR